MISMGVNGNDGSDGSNGDATNGWWLHRHRSFLRHNRLRSLRRQSHHVNLHQSLHESYLQTLRCLSLQRRERQ